jgi:hypothetical protein
VKETHFRSKNPKSLRKKKKFKANSNQKRAVTACLEHTRPWVHLQHQEKEKEKYIQIKEGAIPALGIKGRRITSLRPA